ncbi:MAG: sulfotransferase [Sulfobacillus sp.]
MNVVWLACLVLHWGLAAGEQPVDVGLLGEKVNGPFGTSCFLPTGAKRPLCGPTIWLAGLPKCGTSALYYYLSHHPRIHATHHKELCPQSESAVNASNIRDFLQQLTDEGPSEEALLHQKMYFNGCIAPAQPTMLWIADNMRIPYIIMIFRALPDMAYSSWNFFCQRESDATCTSNKKWAPEPNQYRSPELFHEYLLAGDRFLNNPTKRYLHKDFPQLFRDKQAINGSKVIAVSSEDLYRDTNRTVQRIFRQMGLPEHPLPLEVLSQAVNVASHRGVHALSNKEKGMGASLTRGLLPESRQFICRKWEGDRLLMQSLAGIRWDKACALAAPAPPLNVNPMEKYKYLKGLYG